MMTAYPSGVQRHVRGLGVSCRPRKVSTYTSDVHVPVHVHVHVHVWHTREWRTRVVCRVVHVHE
jgi:hypothetical protein